MNIWRAGQMRVLECCSHGQIAAQTVTIYEEMLRKSQNDNNVNDFSNGRYANTRLWGYSFR